MGTKTTTLYDIYEGLMPDEDESVYQFIDEDEWRDVEYEIESFNPVEHFTQPNHNGESLADIYADFACGDQRVLVEHYREMIRKNQDIGIIVLLDDEVIDGNHRTVALALEGKTSAKCIRL